MLPFDSARDNRVDAPAPLNRPDPDDAAGFPLSGLPDDLHPFLREVYDAPEARLTDADLDALWAAEQERRDAEAELIDAAVEALLPVLRVIDARARNGREKGGGR